VVAFDADLSTAVFGVFADELARWQRERANDLGIADLQYPMHEPRLGIWCFSRPAIDADRRM